MDPSIQREVYNDRPRILSTSSRFWLLESRGRRGSKPPQPLGHASPRSGQLDGAARMEARARRRAIGSSAIGLGKRGEEGCGRALVAAGARSGEMEARVWSGFGIKRKATLVSETIRP